MHRRVPLVLAIWLLAASAAAETPGRTLYARYCASCHGADARGDGPVGAALKTRPADLTRIAERQGGWYPDVVVRDTIDGRFTAHGPREMPIWGNTLEPAQLEALTEYLHGLQRHQPD